MSISTMNVNINAKNSKNYTRKLNIQYKKDNISWDKLGFIPGL